MTVIRENEIRFQTVLKVGELMLVAARTAPKGRGIDDLDYCLLFGDELLALANKMHEIAARDGMAFFSRDADNVLNSQALVLLGTRIQARGIKKCGFCGFIDCAEKNTFANSPCAFNTGDLGIAIGSAVSVAANNRVDNRIMFSVGVAAMELGLMQKDIKITYGIPLSVGSKSIFFDRG